MRLLLVCVVATSVALSVSICIVVWFRKGTSVKDVEGGGKADMVLHLSKGGCVNLRVLAPRQGDGMSRTQGLLG